MKYLYLYPFKGMEVPQYLVWQEQFCLNAFCLLIHKARKQEHKNYYVNHALSQILLIDCS